MVRSLLALFMLLTALCTAQASINVGSKRFTESYILAEIVAQTIRNAGETVAVHHTGMGNTGILFEALKSGAIDLYPEYTGTIAIELLQRRSVGTLEDLNRELAGHGLAAGLPFGFNNAYALAMREDKAAGLGVRSISDLARHPALRLGLSQEFLNRKDGWPALRKAYRLPWAAPRGLDHGLAYEALAAGSIDVMDVYTTDAKLARYRLRTLEDDRRFFPSYEAVLLYRRDVPARYPLSWAALEGLQGRISNPAMIALNAQVELDKAPFSAAAASFLAGRDAGPAQPAAQQRSLPQLLFGADFVRLTREHLVLVFGSLAASAAIGVPLGVWAAHAPRAGQWILAAAGAAQTIPSLALLAFLVAFTGAIGMVPALGALFLYALLPIVRNTQSGLSDIPPALRESARALGLATGARLRQIELPLAARTIFAGIKTSAVINVGTATIAAFIGAGGYGERIVAGLAVHDHAMLLAGALPAAALALLIQWTFDLMDRWTIPRGLRAGGRGL
jgi:osmoprotectant transport system permease protein